MYKGTYALKFEEIFKTNREIEKDFKTRQTEANDLPIPKWKLTIARQKFSFRTRTYWNFVPLWMRDLKESRFKIEIKKFLKVNEQTFRNFSRDINIIGGTEADANKKKILENLQTSDDQIVTVGSRKGKKKSKEANEQHTPWVNTKNPYLKKKISRNLNFSLPKR